MLFIASVNLSDKPAYVIYDSNGEQVTYDELVQLALEHEITFFGEIHNNAIAHWLQLELVKSLTADTTQSLTIGMEMFERDQQILIDEYFAGLISQSSFESEARLWNNYKTDYKPIVEYAKDNELDFIATNIPRRYASAVYNQGLAVLDTLSNEAKKWISPLPVDVDEELPGYKSMAEEMQGHGGEHMISSQAIKDATMAYSIYSNRTENGRFFHLNGAYHSKDGEGIIWYLNRFNTDSDILTIHTITSEDVENIEMEELMGADITIAVAASMTTTY